jgi:cytosine deaminase
VQDGLPRFDLDHGIVLPRLVDVHTHIDKGHIWQRAQNPDGTHHGRAHAVMADRERTGRARMSQSAWTSRCAAPSRTAPARCARTSTAIRKQTPISWAVFAEMREQWKGRIALQAVALFPIDFALTTRRNSASWSRPWRSTAACSAASRFSAKRRAAHRCDARQGVRGCHRERPRSRFPRRRERFTQRALARADRRGCAAPQIQGPHRRRALLFARACRDNERATIIAKVAEAGIAVVSLPMCNMYLQDRAAGRTPRWRGVAPLHELDAAGVTVMVASDNTRDPFYAYGDLDMLEVYREATRILHFDHSDRPWLKTIAATPGEVMGLPNGRMAVGAPAGWCSRARAR